MSRGKHPKGRMLSNPRIVHNTDIAKEYDVLSVTPKLPLSYIFDQKDLADGSLNIKRTAHETDLIIIESKGDASLYPSLTFDEMERQKLFNILKELINDQTDKAWSKEVGGLGGRLSLSKFDEPQKGFIALLSIRASETSRYPLSKKEAVMLLRMLA